jgi:hypothetical protein
LNPNACGIPRPTAWAIELRTFGADRICRTAGVDTLDAWAIELRAFGADWSANPERARFNSL